MTQRQKSSSVRAAVIGLIGTLLTMYGGLTGAAVSAAVTVCLPQAGQPAQVWEDLQAYIDSFRVIR